ncbi:MAG: tetratricopeptide repeat protein [Anaerolineales bacterium]|nr:tetratricopeptide repeat protein [Anaerolineales bacterium]
MDSIKALDRVDDSLSKGTEILDFSESGITGECAQQVQEIVRQRKSGNVTEEALDNLLSCLKSGDGLNILGLICLGQGYWNLSVIAYEKSIIVFENTGNVHGSAQTYGNLGSVYLKMGKWEKAIEYYQKSLETNEKMGDVQSAAQKYNNLGLVYSDMGEWEKAIEYYQKSLETNEKMGNVHSVAQTYNNLGLVYSHMGEWEKAIEYYQKSLETNEKMGDVQGAARIYVNFGSVYYNVGKWEKAIEYYQKSLEIFEKLGDVQGVAQTYGSFGLVYSDMGEWKKAIEYYQKDLKISEKLGDVKGAAQNYGNLGSVYLNMGEWKKAIEYYQKDLEISEKIGDEHCKGITLSNLGRLHLDKKPPELENALKYLEDSISSLNREARPDYPNALNWLALCYHMIGNSRKAEAKREKNQNKKEKLVNSASGFFSSASERYSELSGLPRVDISSLDVYKYLDKGLSYSVKSITEKDDNKAIELLGNALGEFKKALKVADKTEKIRIKGIIHDHEAKKYIRLALSETNHAKQDKHLGKAIESLEKAAKLLKDSGQGEQCDFKTCEGCMHLFKGLKLFRKGIKEYTKSGINKSFSDSVFELKEAQKCYEGAVNELGKDTVGSLKESFEYVEGLLKSKDETLVMRATDEFIKIIDELSSVGLQKIVKLYTFDESMNVSSVKSESGGAVQMQYKSSSGMSIPDAATIAGFFAWLISGALVYYGYTESNNISIGIGALIFIVLLGIITLKRVFN